MRTPVQIQIFAIFSTVYGTCHVYYNKVVFIFEPYLIAELRECLKSDIITSTVIIEYVRQIFSIL